MRPRTRRGNRISRQGQSSSRIAIAASGFVIVLLVGWAIGSRLLPASAPQIVAADARIARLQLAPDRHNLCEQFEWDNGATPLTPKGILPCRDGSPLGAPNDQGALAGRMSGISTYFKKR